MNVHILESGTFVHYAGKCMNVPLWEDTVDGAIEITTPASLGALLRDRRRALGWTQQDLADASGTSRRWIVAMEAGKDTAEVGLVMAALSALGVHLRVAFTDPNAPSALDAHLGRYTGPSGDPSPDHTGSGEGMAP